VTGACDCDSKTGRDANSARDDRRERGPDNRPFWLLLERSWAVAARLWLVCLVFLALSGCGSSKEELESAKQQIAKLNGDTMKLNEAVANLDKEKTRASNDLKLLSEKDAELQKTLQEALGKLRKDNAALADKTSELERKVATMEGAVSSLKTDKEDLMREVEKLKKRVAVLPEPAQESGSGANEPPQEPSAREPLSRARETLTPCDALIQFMKASRAIVQGHKGENRAKLLQQVKKDYSSRLREAPDKAVKAAESWVEELSASWDKTHNDSVSNLLKKRNAALEACGKKPQEAGF
jgi:hypothetical protein